MLWRENSCITHCSPFLAGLTDRNALFDTQADGVEEPVYRMETVSESKVWSLSEIMRPGLMSDPCSEHPVCLVLSLVVLPALWFKVCMFSLYK